MAFFLAKKISIPTKYADFSDIFFKKFTKIFSNCSNIYKNTIDKGPGKQPLYAPIHSFGLIEVENLKTYIKTNLANRFLQFSKSPTRVYIFFVQKSNKGLHLYLDYVGLNNLTIKIRYSPLLIIDILDWLKKAKRFIQFNLISTYYYIRIKEKNI